ncbi:MAG: endonuclease/exonuclease/phosphatase family protein [Candidatus Omnitrophica bacterium]|nr:endonuclease/exonuclease/phosphatase family protein [Candidatus Omnitrophota bacterium]
MKRYPLWGPVLRVASWNIQWSMGIPQAITVFTDPEGYSKLIDPQKAPVSSEKYKRAIEERDLISQADIIFLQEMDIGAKRSGYINAPKVLADALGMNYAYGATYLEIDPAYLGTESIQYEEGSLDQEAMEYFKADPKQYKGLFGVALLSRYPIKSVKIFPLKHQGYDWYWGEKNKVTFLEKTRRFGAKAVFLSEVHREMKVGGRNFMRVDLHVPGLPQDTLTVINIHLEIKCLPQAREEQIREILSYLGPIRNPVIMAGDFNSAPSDLSPTSVVREAKRQAKNPTNWFSLAVAQVLPQALLVNTTRATSNLTKNFQNPTARHIPIIAPNYTAGLFKAIEEFQFDDGHVFDFRGDPERSVRGDSGLLSNSNQRDAIGYKTTFQVRRPLGPIIGKYRLDWIFVKSFLTGLKDQSGPYRFAPHFGRTLEDMNTVLVQPVSDHHPNMVDLPFEEPGDLAR